MTNPFALATIQQNQAQPDQGAAANPFALKNIRPESDPQLRATLMTAVREDPVKTARASELALETGLPTEVVARNLMDVELQQAVERADATLKTDPSVMRRFKESPLFAAKAQQDIESLIAVHGELKGWQGPKPTLTNIARGLAASLPNGMEIARKGMSMQMGDFLRWAGLIESDPVREADQMRKMAQLQGRGDFTRPEFDTATARAVYGGLESTLRMAPGVIAAIVTRNPAPALATAGVQTQAEAYGKYRVRGADPLEAFVGATGEGAVEAATEMLPMKFLADAFGKKGFSEFITGLLAREVPSEQVATLLQDAIDTAVANPNKTWGEYLAERPEAAYSTLVSTITQSAVMGGASRVMASLTGQADQIAEAEASTQKLQAAFAAATTVKMREHSAPDFARAIQTIADEEEGTAKSVFIDAQVLAQAGVDVAVAFPGAQEAYEQALATNGTVELPIGQVLALVPGTPLEQVFLQNARANERALSMAEAKQAGETGEQFIAQEAERILAQAADQDAWSTSAETVKTTILDQLNTAGRFTPDVNEAYATLVRDFYSVTASRAGMTPDQMYARYPLRVGAQGQTAGTLDQAEKKPAGLRLWHGSPDPTWIDRGEAFDPTRTVNAPSKYQFLTPRLNVAETYAGISEMQRWKAENGMGAAPAPTAGVREFVLPKKAKLLKVKDVKKAAAKLGVEWTGDNPLETLLDAAKAQGYDAVQMEMDGGNVAVLNSALLQRAPQQALAQSPAPFDGPETGNTPIGDATTVEVDGKTRPALNSNGQAIHPTLEGVRNFWRWFGDSKVVDAEGRPLVVYHGRGEDFTEFNTQGGKGKSFNTGAFFTANPAVASTYATGTERNVAPVYLRIAAPVVIDAKGKNWSALGKAVTVKTPAAERVSKTAQEDENLLAELEGREPTTVAPEKVKAKSSTLGKLFPREFQYGDETFSTDDLTRWVRKEGFEGVRFDNVRDQGPSGMFATDESQVPSSNFVVFDPTQIKSATGNSGAFNGQDANILRQSAVPSLDDVRQQWTDAGIKHSIIESRGRITLSQIIVSQDERSTGKGTAAMRALVDYADRTGQRIELTPSSDFGGNKKRLTEFYKRFGFVENKGRNKDFEISEGMYREPAAFNQQARGTYNPQTLLITLGENSDLSTFLHESGHFFLEVLADLASQPNAPAGVAEDMSKVLAWFGIRGNETVGGADSGAPLAQAVDQTETPEFKAWFGDWQAGWKNTSVVRKWATSSKDKPVDLPPRVVYHGTRADFISFAPVREGNVTTMFGDEETVTRHGIFFADDPDFAATFAKQAGEGAPKVVPVYLDIRNPMELEDGFSDELIAKLREAGLPEEQADRLRYRKTEMAWAEFDDESGEALVAAAKRAGFDGAYTREPGVGLDGEEDQYVWVAFDSTQIKSAIGNSGAFDPNNPSILAQDGNAPTDNTQPAGRTPLEVWNAMTLDQKRQYHERWAESFEQYLLEGKAPSAELQPLFRRFRSWLVNVYKSLTHFMRGRDLKLNDEIRQVFDRLVATDEQIAQAEETAGMLPDFDATNEAIEKLTARSLRDLKWAVNARNKKIRELQKQAKELRKDVEAEVTAEVNAMPEVRAKEAIDELRKSTPEYKTALAEWKAQRQAAYDQAVQDVTFNLLATEGAGLTGLDKAQFISKNKRRIANEAEGRALDWERQNAKPERTLVGSEADLALVADQTGYSSVEDMLAAIDAFGRKADVIEGMTDQRMLERHGDLVDQRAIEDAATEAVHNDARARALATELKAQADALNPREQTGTSSNGRPVTVNALERAAKEFAKNLAARRRIKDLKAAAAQHRAAEARAGKAWQKATTEGKTQEAVQAKRDQLLNNQAVRVLQEAQAEAKKIVEFFRRVTDGSNEKTVERGRDPDVVNAMRAILASYDVMPRLEKGALEYMETVARNDPAMYAALAPSVQAALNNAKPLSEMSMEELRGLNDELRAMWDLAKRSRQMEVDGNLLDIEEAADRLVERMGEIGIPDEIPGERRAISDAEERGIKLQFAKAILSRVEQWAERMDGKLGGPFLRLVFQPVKDAADRYRTDRVTYRKQFTKLLENVAPALPPGPIAAPELGYTFGAARDSGTAELLHAILHTGNDSNKRKLLLGRGWASENADGTLDTSKWDAFMQRMTSEGKITKAHYDFAQGVWDLLEQMKPLAQETHRKVFGRYFAEVTADPVVTPFGTYRGGYVPAQTDSRLVTEAKIRELAEGENESMAYAFPSSPSGFTKSRVEYNRPLLLDIRALAQHTDKVLLFSHMQGAVTDVRRLLSQKNVSYALDRVQPGAYEGMLIPWLNRAAKQVVETPVMGDRKISRFLSGARSRAGMAMMFANLSNTAQQITGFSSAAVKVKPGLLMKATAQAIANPLAMRKSVADASAYMKDRMLNETSAMTDAVEDILVNPSVYEKAQAWSQRHAYFMQSAVDNFMSPIVWTGAYNQAVEQGESHEDAVRFADGTVRQTQGSTLPEDISRFESGPAYARLFTQFVSYFNMMANTNATAMSQIVGEMGLKKGAGKLVYVALAGLLVPIWVAEAVAQAFRGGPEDDDDDGYLDDWLAAVFGLGTLKGLLAQVPIVGQAGQLVLNRFNDNPADDKFSLSPAVSLIESAVSSPASVYKAIVDEGNAQKAVRDVAAAATLATGLPFYAAARPIGYLAGVAQGKVQPTSGADAVRGTVTGAVSPESRTP